MAKKYIFLNIRNRAGSVQHYYHFLLGLLVPLVLRMDAAEQSGEDVTFLVRSCGPMDRHLLSFNFLNLVIVDCQNSTIDVQLKYDVDHEFIDGFDDPGYYSALAFVNAKKIIKKRLINNMDHSENAKVINTIIINRSVDSFYNSERSEIKTSGIERRSIVNFNELELLVKEKFSDACTLTLENATLADQVLKFENATTIIAQHGAALANIIFCGRQTKIVEIIPRRMLTIGHFSKLANMIGLKYSYYVTDHNHAVVDLKEFSSNFI